MNAVAQWLEGHVASRETAKYLNAMAQLVVALVAAWYVTRQVLARGNAAAALNV